MKIYCSTRNKTLEDFIGEDLWVKMYDRGMCEYFYRKFLETYYDSNNQLIISYREMPAIELELLNKTELTIKDRIDFWYHEKYYKDVMTRDIDYFSMGNSFVTPIEIISDEEFYETLNAIKERLS